MELSNTEQDLLLSISQSKGYVLRELSLSPSLINLKGRGLIYEVVDPLFGHTWHITDIGKVVLRQCKLLAEYDMPDGIKKDDADYGLRDKLDTALNRIDELETALASLIEVADKNSEYLIGETQDTLMIEIQQAEKVLENKNPPN